MEDTGLVDVNVVGGTICSLYFFGSRVPFVGFDFEYVSLTSFLCLSRFRIIIRRVRLSLELAPNAG